MKRDFDLVRAILLAVEAAPETASLSNSTLQVEGFTPVQISAHVQLLEEAGLVHASISREIGSVTPRNFHIYRLRWAGHEFLDNIRDPEIWQKTKGQALSRGATLTFDVIKAIAIAFVKEKLNLP